MFQFGSGKLICTPTNAFDGSVIAAPTPVILGSMQDISVDISVEIKTLYGAGRYPIAVGQGKGKIEIKGKNAEIDGGVYGSLFFGKQATAGIKAAELDFPMTIPTGTPWEVTVAPPGGGTFVADLGVFRTDTGMQMTRVADAATPATGQYKVSSAGKYTFAAADASKPAALSYEYSATTGGQIWTMTNDIMGYTPSFSLLLQNGYDGKKLVMKLNRCVSGKLGLPYKADDFAVGDFEAQAFANAAGIVGYICLF